MKFIYKKAQEVSIQYWYTEMLAFYQFSWLILSVLQKTFEAE